MGTTFTHIHLKFVLILGVYGSLMDAFMQWAGVSESERALLDLKFRAKRYTCSMSVTCRGSYSTTLQTSDLDAPPNPAVPRPGVNRAGATQRLKSNFSKCQRTKFHYKFLFAFCIFAHFLDSVRDRAVQE